jgi:hypothetical protein
MLSIINKTLPSLCRQQGLTLYQYIWLERELDNLKENKGHAQNQLSFS